MERRRAVCASPAPLASDIRPQPPGSLPVVRATPPSRLRRCVRETAGEEHWAVCVLSCAGGTEVQDPGRQRLAHVA
jgi:hypothetical protein